MPKRTTNGDVLQRARQDKEAEYWELLKDGRCHHVVVALVTGGRWSEEVIAFINGPRSGRCAKGGSMLAISWAFAFISSPVDMWMGTDGPAPDMADLFDES